MQMLKRLMCILLIILILVQINVYSFGEDQTSVPEEAKHTLPPELKSIENVLKGVQITWTAPDGAVRYRVLRKVGNSDWEKLSTTRKTSFTDKTVESGKEYTYTVYCISSDAKKKTCDYDEKGKTITFLAAPGIKSVKNVSNGVQIQWTASEGAAKYRVLRKTGEGDWKTLADLRETSYTDRSTTSGTEYTYTVCCISGNGKKQTSAYNKGITKLYIAEPTLIGVKNTPDGVQVSWKASAGAEQYRVIRKSGSGEWEKLLLTEETNYIDKTAEKGRKYTYSVYCVSNDGKKRISAYSTAGITITVK